MDRAETIMYLEGLRRTNLVTCSRQPFDEPCPKQVSLENGKQASEKKTSDWISVSERLPQEYGAVCKNVILLMDDGFVTVGWLNQVTRKGYYLDAVNDDVIRGPISRFTHWMPLPEPPEEGG